jgi:hypothetical protein
MTHEQSAIDMDFQLSLPGQVPYRDVFKELFVGQFQEAVMVEE